MDDKQTTLYLEIEQAKWDSLNRIANSLEAISKNLNISNKYLDRIQSAIGYVGNTNETTCSGIARPFKLCKLEEKNNTSIRKG